MRRATARDRNAVATAREVGLATPKPMRLKGKLKTRMPPEVLAMAHTPAGFYPALAYESWRLDPELRYADSVGRLKLCGWYAAEGTLMALLCGPSARRAAPEDAARYSMAPATQVAELRFYATEAPKWVLTCGPLPAGARRLRTLAEAKAAWAELKENA